MFPSSGLDRTRGGTVKIELKIKITISIPDALNLHSFECVWYSNGNSHVIGQNISIPVQYSDHGLNNEYSTSRHVSTI